LSIGAGKEYDMEKCLSCEVPKKKKNQGKRGERGSIVHVEGSGLKERTKNEGGEREFLRKKEEEDWEPDAHAPWRMDPKTAP